MLDLVFLEVALVIWLEGLTIVTHSLRPVSAHLLVFLAADLAIELVETIVHLRLLNCLPRVLN